MQKLALVTGASRGIGAAIAERLAADGMKVLVHYNGSEARARDLADRIGNGATIVQTDLAEPDGGKVLASKVPGPIDVLVNNAGLFEVAPLTEVTDEQFESVLAVNVRSVFYLTREVARTMPDGGRIVTIGSVGGRMSSFPGNSVYSMSKFAIRGMSASWARDLAPRQITSNVVQPGPVATELNSEDGPNAAMQLDVTPLKRFAKPSEVAAAVSYLCSDEAGFVTGGELDVAGGWGV
jgi:3-oxoacyl-[acyl-carrier protein] reductase